MAAEVPVVVIDNGSRNSKAGFSGDDSPKAVFPSIIGRPRHLGPIAGIELKDYYVGSVAKAKRGILSLKYPIEHGVVTNWDDMEKLLEYTFRDQLQVDPGEHPVLLSEPPCNPRISREKMTQVMFEKFHCPAMYMAVSAVLALYNSGNITGVVCDSGHGVSCAVPVYEGHSIPHAVFKTDFAGWDMTMTMSQLLIESGYTVESGYIFNEMVTYIKHQLSYVALDLEQEITVCNEQSYELPDGEVIKLGNEIFKCPESMFQPTLRSMDCPAIQEILHNSITRCDIDIRKDLYANVVLNGGNTLFKGFVERLQREMTSLAPSEMNVKVNAHSEMKYPAWIGGSILASLPTFKEMCVNKDEYDEYGPVIVHKKCF